MAEFVRVSALSDIPPGAGKCVEVNGKPIALFNIDGMVFAIDNECLHRQGPLAEGELEGHVVTCPWHGWQYDVRTGENVFDRALRLETYEVVVEDGEVKVVL